jgi:preprotein translocase subunit SecA
MGFWAWLTGKSSNVTEANDVIWMTPAAKWQGLRRAIQEDASIAQLVVAHFPKTLAELQDELTKTAIAFSTIEGRLSATEARRLADQGNRRPLLVLADSLQIDEFPTQSLDSGQIAILVAERHLLRTHDDRIVDFARGLGRRCRLTFHLSLGDPLLKVFVGEWIKDMLARLGMTESEALVSRMVARRIKGAQAQLAKRALDDRKADCAEEWVRVNVPGMAE